MLLCFGLVAPSASAAEFPYTIEPRLSLTGDCSTTPPFDSVVDPDCPYSAPPAGPSGRFDRPKAVAVDDWGNVYVASRSGDGTEGQIDVFDSEGHFITELDDPFGPWSIAVDGEGNLYAYESLIGVAGEEEKIVRYPPTTYNPAAGEIEYDPSERTTVTPSVSPSGLAIDRQDKLDPSDDLLIAARNIQITVYSSAKDGNTLLDTIKPSGLAYARYVAVDTERRRLYTTTCKAGEGNCVIWVLKADAPYDFVEEIDGSETPAGKFFTTEGWISIAADETNGHLFIGDLGARTDIFELDENYEFVSRFKYPAALAGGGVQSDVAENLKAPDPEDENPLDNYRHLYVPFLSPAGNAIAYAPPAVGPAEIKSAAVQGIGETEAELEALIHPHQLETTYALEYVSEAQFAIDGFESAIVAKSGTLSGGATSQRVSTVIGGLVPGEGYRLRVVAENEANKGVPKEIEVAFATYDDADPDPEPGACPNRTLRVGLSALLPDCRAYELVTPPEANGPAGAGPEGQRFGAVQSSPAGNAVSFELLSGALPGTEATGAFQGDPYVATRSASGWSTELAGPTGTMASKPIPGSFSPDQGHLLWNAEGEGSLTLGGQGANYVRYPDGRSELTGRGSLGTDPRAVGRLITENGTHIIFETGATVAPAIQLEPDAPSGGIRAVYDRTADEATHVVSLLPGEVTPVQDAFYAGASADGEGIAFRIGTTLYLRVRNEATYAIGAGAKFAGLADGGERIFYLEGGDLKAFDAATEETITFADTAADVTPVNVAPQGTRAYFVSESALGGANPNGDSAVPGEPNLYLAEEDEGAIATSFVATVTELDVEGIENEGTKARGDGLGLWIESLEKRQPALVPSRLTPEGSVLVFQSRADLDGYQPDGDPQVYRYDHDSVRLTCVSCPPTKTPSTGGAVLQSINSFSTGAPLGPYGFVPAVAAGGDRLFFESTEALVSTDTDGLRDVYEWEEDGVGSCDRKGGCVYLISSGGSSRPDYLFGHSASGDDVFVSTTDVLVPGSPEKIMIYDARVGGGFAQASPSICMYIDECRLPATPAPALPQPGPPSGNPDSPKPKPCPRGKRKVKRKGKFVCVKKKGKKQRKAANRGAGR